MCETNRKPYPESGQDAEELLLRAFKDEEERKIHQAQVDLADMPSLGPRKPKLAGFLITSISLGWYISLQVMKAVNDLEYFKLEHGRLQQATFAPPRPPYTPSQRHFAPARLRCSPPPRSHCPVLATSSAT